MMTFIDIIRVLLTEQEIKHGPLELLSSRDTEETSRVIDEIIDVITTHFTHSHVKNIFEMYDIKIFGEDINFKTKHALSMSVICYNYLFLSTNFSSRYFLKTGIKLAGSMQNIWTCISPYLFLEVIHINNNYIRIE